MSRLETAVREAIDEVGDLASGQSVLKLGLVRDIAVNGEGDVTLRFEPASSMCPVAFSVGIDIHDRVMAVDGIRSIHFDIRNFVRAEELAALVNDDGAEDASAAVALVSRKKLIEQFGGAWVGVRFLDAVPSGLTPPKQKAAGFCDIMSDARLRPVRLVPGDIECKEGVKPFNWPDSLNGNGTPCAAVAIGDIDDADVFLLHAQPKMVMEIIGAWERNTGQTMNIDVIGDLSDCGNTAYRSYRSGATCLSFGCAEGRNRAKVTRDRMTVALPAAVAQKLI